VTLCSNVAGYQRFGGPCLLHLQGEVAGTKGFLLICCMLPNCVFSDYHKLTDFMKAKCITIY